MDAIHYDKIADKLVNFHSKLPEITNLENNDAIHDVKEMKNMIAIMLQAIDRMAIKDNNGWIR